MRLKSRRRRKLIWAPFGFSLIEVMLAVGISASLGLALFAAQAALKVKLQQILVRQLVLPSVINLANQLAYLEPSYAETSYDDNTFLSGFDCALAVSSCTKDDYVKYIIYRWKSDLAQLPLSNIRAIVCFDDDQYSHKIPRLDATACASGGRNLVIKLLWDGAANNLIPLAGVNYFVIRVP
jgi:prepilin-type N-terminal cleavage/methylation domain-containing protein